MEMQEKWDKDASVMVLKTYLGMAYEAKSEAAFRATLRLIVEFIDEVDYLGEQGK